MQAVLVGSVCLFLAANLVAQPQAVREGVAAAKAKATAKSSAAAKPGATPEFKAIWEPVSFNKDIELKAITCVAVESCYAVGEKGTVIFTSDGGKTWQVQLGGDTESTDRRLVRVHFIDAKNGWAMSENGKILGTRDGSTWAELTTVSGTTNGLWFLTPQVGLELENPRSTSQSTLQRTMDGGKTWAPLHKCTVETTVGGLARRLDCMLDVLQIFGPNTIFGGGGAEVAMASRVATFAKSGDGGQTWKTSVIPETKWSITDVQFWTELDGIVVLSGGEATYWTADGGETWTRSVIQRNWPSHTAVGGEGKIIVDVQHRGIGYSFNGGRNFTSRAMALPAEVNDVTFPDARHGYLVGRHGMVYRYRIVPYAYMSQGMIGAMAP